MIVRVITIVEEFIDSLDDITQSKIIKCIKLLREHGPHLGYPYAKKLDRNLYELRALGKIHARVIYCFDGDLAITLHGFIKKSNKISKEDIELAKRRQKQLAL